ncbi:MAG: DUF4249 domain-containing protein [Chitinophagaceae bacterium]|nr:DUF4249 domain-containing protein [Chitinophagaceae bacterium]
MATIKNVFFNVCMLAFLISCTKEDQKNNEAKAVVEAFLQPGIAAQIKVTKQIINGVENNGSRTIDALNVIVTYNNTTYVFKQNSFGVYENTGMPVVAGATYSLQFVYNNETITASTTVPQKPVNFTCSPGSITIPSFSGGPGGGIPSFPEPLKAKWNNTNADYHYIAIKSVDPAASEISTNGRGPAFANTPDQGNSKEINFGEFKYYGRNALILYRVLPELAALYNSTSSNSQNLAAVPTNIVNGLGIFTSVNIADTVFIDVKE